MSTPFIKPELLDQIRPLVDQIRVFGEIDSTNDEARRTIMSGLTGSNLIIANTQNSGRGRRGRKWVSPAGGIYMSLTWPLHESLIQPQALSLVSAISVKQSLESWSQVPLKLKWPNDLLVEGKKLAGILLELQTSKPTDHIVFGVGINYSLTDAQKNSIDRKVIDVKELTENLPAREEIVVSICTNLIENSRKFFNQGFDHFKRIWNESDCYLGSNIVIKSDKSEKLGKSLGVNDQANLIIETDLGQELISSGEIYFDLNEARRSFDGDT